MAQVPTFEEIDRAMDAVQLDRGARTLDIGQVCAVWPPIKLILQAIAHFFPKWRERIEQFIAIVDAFCKAGGGKK